MHSRSSTTSNCRVSLVTDDCCMDSDCFEKVLGMLQDQTKLPLENISELRTTALARSHEVPRDHSPRGVVDDVVALGISSRCVRLQHPAWRRLRCRRELEGCELAKKAESELATEKLA